MRPSPASREIIVADAASLRQLAIADALERLRKMGDTIILIDIVALELAADPEAPGARVAQAWIAAGTAPGSLTPIEIAVTETGSLLRLARQVDPSVSAKNACRRAVIDFVAERMENSEGLAGVICHDEVAARAIANNSGAVIVPLTPAFAERLAALTDGVEVDLGERIDGEVSLQ